MGDNHAEDVLLREQIAYYRARAEEYDASLREGLTVGERAELEGAADAIRRLAQGKDVLEIACGTGLFTQAAAAVSASLTALDAAPEMLALNRERLAGRGVYYVLADIFEWKPTESFEVVFFAFWLSHVPPARLAGFLATVRRALRPGGQVLILDEHPIVWRGLQHREGVL
jgi:demethylmenaquinone methyltransferase/2-methoxy-6-polyprenyl-1,4-benzoquinol methylase